MCCTMFIIGTVSIVQDNYILLKKNVYTLRYTFLALQYSCTTDIYRYAIP